MERKSLVALLSVFIEVQKKPWCQDLAASVESEHESIFDVATRLYGKRPSQVLWKLLNGQVVDPISR